MSNTPPTQEELQASMDRMEAQYNAQLQQQKYVQSLNKKAGNPAIRFEPIWPENKNAKPSDASQPSAPPAPMGVTTGTGETNWIDDAKKFVDNADKVEADKARLAKQVNQEPKDVINQTKSVTDQVADESPSFGKFIENAYNSSLIGTFRDLKVGSLLGDIAYHKYAQVFSKPEANNTESDEIIRKYVSDFVDRKKVEEADAPDPKTWYGKVGKFVATGVFDLPLYAMGGGLTGKVIKSIAGETASKGLIGVLAEKNLTQIADSFASSNIAKLAIPTAITAAEGAVIGAGDALVKSPGEQMMATGQAPTIGGTAKDIAAGTAMGAVTGPIVGAGMVAAPKALFNGGKVFAETVVSPVMKWADKFVPVHSSSQVRLQAFKANVARVLEKPEIIEALPGKTKEQTINFVRNSMDKLDALQQKDFALDDKIKSITADAFSDFKSRAGINISTFNRNLVKLSEQEKDIHSKIIEMANRIKNGMDVKTNTNKLNRANSELIKIKTNRQKLNIAIQNEMNKLTLDEKRTAEMFSESIKKRISEINQQRNDINAQMNMIANSSGYKTIVKAHELGLFSGKTPMKPSDLMTVRGVLVDPDIAKELSRLPSVHEKMDFDGNWFKKSRELLKAPGITVDEVNNVLLRDVYRTAEKIDNVSNGITTKVAVEPMAIAKAAELEQFSKRASKFGEMLKGAGISLPPDNEVTSAVYEKIFRSADEKKKLSMLNDLLNGRLADEDRVLLSKEMLDLAKYMRTTLEDDRRNYNAIATRLNLPEIGNVKDYLKKIRETNFFDDIGYTKRAGEKEASPIGVKRSKVSLGGSDKARTGEWEGGYEDDPIDSFMQYSRNVLRFINLQEPSSIARAHINLMPPANRDYFNSWLNYFMGAQDPVDQFIQNYLGPVGAGWINVIGKVKPFIGNSVIAGNTNVVLQQPTTSMFTWAHTDAKSWAKAAKQMLANPDLMHKFVYDNDEMFRIRSAEKALSPEFKIGSKLLPTGKKIDLNKLDLMEYVSKAGRAADLEMYKHSFVTAYINGKSNYGFSDAAAIAHAKNIARKSQNIFSPLFLAPSFRSTALWPGMAFKSFAANLAQQLMHDPKYTYNSRLFERNIGLTMSLIGSMTAANLIYKAIGMRQPFNVPFSDTKGSDGSLRITKDPGDLMPVFRDMSMYGTPTVYRAVQDMFILTTSYQNERDRQAAADRLWKLPWMSVKYGVQIQRLLDAIEADRTGYIKKGKKEIPIEKGDPLRILIGGKSNTKALQR